MSTDTPTPARPRPLQGTASVAGVPTGPLTDDDAEALRQAVRDAQRMIRFHMDRADRFHQRAMRAEAELAHRDHHRTTTQED